MYKFSLACSFALLMVQAALAQTPPAVPAATKLFAAATEIPALVAKAKAERKGDQPLIVQTILSLEPYRVNLEYRPGKSPPTLHEKDAEMLYVLEGSATLVTGGKLIDEKRTNATDFIGTAIAGGQQQVIAKGDFAIVPENTPHQVILAGNAAVTLMSIHVPRPIQTP